MNMILWRKSLARSRKNHAKWGLKKRKKESERSSAKIAPTTASKTQTMYLSPPFAPPFKFKQPPKHTHNVFSLMSWRKDGGGGLIYRRGEKWMYDEMGRRGSWLTFPNVCFIHCHQEKVNHEPTSHGEATKPDTKKQVKILGNKWKANICAFNVYMSTKRLI